MTFSLSELKVTPSFCFPFKIPDDPTTSTVYLHEITLRLWSLSVCHCDNAFVVFKMSTVSQFLKSIFWNWSPNKMNWALQNNFSNQLLLCIKLPVCNSVKIRTKIYFSRTDFWAKIYSQVTELSSKFHHWGHATLASC